jgi:hypothetical protein
MTDNRGADVLGERPASSGARGGLVRPLLWLLLVISLAADVVISSMHLSVFVELPVGLVGMACIVGLVMHHFRHRRG